MKVSSDQPSWRSARTLTDRGICRERRLTDEIVAGKGIAETDLHRLFNPFCQLDRGDRKGLGLGLFISKSIVQAHGGTIWAESRLGSGSTFFFTVPAARPSHGTKAALDEATAN